MKDMIRKMIVGSGLVRGIDIKTRRVTAYASTNDWDRYGERFEADAFRDGMKAYLGNPVVLWAHDYSRPPIAKTVDHSFDERGLILTMEFADTAEARDIFALYQGGFLSAFSVGFKPIEVAYEERTPGGEMGAVFKKAELLENSAVPVPANPGALVMKGLMGAACRAFGVKEPEDKPAPAGPSAPAPDATETDPAAPATDEPSPEPSQDPGTPAAAPAAPASPDALEAGTASFSAGRAPDLKATLGYLLALGKIINGQGKVADAEVRSLLIQANNLFRSLVYGEGAGAIQEPGDELSAEEMSALVKEYELLSEKVIGDPRATDADRKELEAIGRLIEKAIEGKQISGE